MNRALYTGALSMIARSIETEVISNNLANLNTVGFKKDTTVYMDFPSMMLHRLGDNTLETPFGSVDLAPRIGRVGTGVQVDDIPTMHRESASYIQSGKEFDMALEGVPGVKTSYGFFEVQTPQGKRFTRAGNFTVNSEGFLVTQGGSFVMGEKGPIQLQANNFKFEPDGTIFTNPNYEGEGVNMWDDKGELDKIRIVAFKNAGELEKEGYVMFNQTEGSGPPESILFGVQLRTGMLEASNVNPVIEMVNLIKSQRSYEASAKVIQTADTLLGQAVNDVGRVA